MTNPRDAGDHFQDDGPEEGTNEFGGRDLRLDPAPEVFAPTAEEWAEGCRILGLDPEDGPAGQPHRPPYPGDDRAERFLRHALQNGDEYDLSDMPRSYAAAAVGVIFTLWTQRYLDTTN